MIYQRANKRGLSRDCRLSFAVCFSRRIKRFRGKASSSVDFSPFHLLYLKGVKTHRGTGKAGTIIYPSAEADGKREAAARGLPHSSSVARETSAGQARSRA